MSGSGWIDWCEQKRRAASLGYIAVMAALLSYMIRRDPGVSTYVFAASIVVFFLCSPYLMQLYWRLKWGKALLAHAVVEDLRRYGFAPESVKGIRDTLPGVLDCNNGKWTWIPTQKFKAPNGSFSLNLGDVDILSYRRAWGPLLPRRGYVELGVGGDVVARFFVIGNIEGLIS